MKKALPSRQLSCLLSAAIAACLAPSSVLAQQGAALEEVMVTAQRREESLQDLSLAVSAFTADMLNAKGVVNAVDLARSTPSLIMVPQNSGNTTFGVQMRGVGQSDSVLTADSPVGLYVDGIALNKISGTLIDFIEPERVEVLRGPQGTLYGRNSTGGAINIVTKKPMEEFGAKLVADFGNFSSKRFQASIDSGKFGVGAGELSSRFTLYSFERDGFGTDLSTGKDLDSRDRIGALAALRWEPSESVMVDYTFDYSDVDEAPPIAQLHVDASGYLGDYVTDQREDDLALSYSFPSEPGGSFGIGRTNTEVEAFGHNLTVSWDVGALGALESLELKSITGYREIDDNEPTDFDGTPIRWADFDIYQTLETFQQEFQLTGSTADDRINFVSGLFYYNEKADSLLPGVFGFGTVQNTPQFETDNDAYALYGQFDWTPDVLDNRLTITAGARYNSEKKRLLNARTVVDKPSDGLNGYVAANVDSVSEDFDNVSPTLTFSYDISDELMGYLRWSRGYKSGGFNGRGSTDEQLLTPFEDETLSAWELGLKSYFFDRRVQLNVAAYMSEYEDLQVARTQAAAGGVGFATVNENIGEITISGVEIELLASPVESLLIDLSYSYTKTDVEEFILCLPTSPDTCVDTNIRNDKVIGLTPDHTANLGIQWTIAQWSEMSLVARMDAYYQSDMLGGGQTMRVSPDSADPGYVDSYSLLNAKLTLADVQLGSGSLDVALWGKNLTDEDDIQWANNLTETGLTVAIARYLDPRTYGIAFTYSF